MRQADVTTTTELAGTAPAGTRHSTVAHQMALLRLRELTGAIDAAWAAFHAGEAAHFEKGRDSSGFDARRWVLPSAATQVGEALEELEKLTGQEWHTLSPVAAQGARCPA